MKVIYGNKRLSVRFQDECENDLSSNQLNIMLVDKIPAEKESDVPTNHETPMEKVPLDKGYYHCVYVMINLKKEVDFNRKENNTEVEDDTDEE